MRIAVDFDGTLVRDNGLSPGLYYPGSPPEAFEALAGAIEWLWARKAQGHTLILYSCRANLSKRRDPLLDPLRTFRIDEWLPELHQRRFEAMVRWVGENCAGLFDHIDDGTQGKVSADLYVDDKAIFPPWRLT